MANARITNVIGSAYLIVAVVCFATGASEGREEVLMRVRAVERLYERGEVLPFFHIQARSSGGRTTDFVTTHPEQLVSGFRIGRYQYADTDIERDHPDAVAVQRDDLFERVLQLSDKEIRSMYFVSGGCLDIVEHENLDGNREFILALMAKGFVPVIGDEAGYLCVED